RADGSMSGARRLEASLVASALLHALALGVVLRGQRVTLRPPLVAIPVALVGGVGGGGPASEPAPAPAPAPVAPPAKPRPRPARGAVARRPTPTPPAPPGSAAPGGGGGGGGVAAGGGGSGGGDGGGGDGSGGARVAYGTNPLPPYPLVARRLGKEGVVLLEV